MATFKPRASSVAPSDAAAMPLPNEDTTPPVTNINRVMMDRRKNVADGPLYGRGTHKK
jgi:hypothetical protein